MTPRRRRSVLRSTSAVLVATAGCAAITGPTENDADEAAVETDWPLFQRDVQNTGCQPRTHGPKHEPVSRYVKYFDGEIWGSPIVADGTVYIGCYDHNLYAFDATTGERDWIFETAGPINSTPAVHDGTIYVGSNDMTVYALDARTSTERWRYDTGGQVMSSPTVVDDTLYIRSHCHSFECAGVPGAPAHDYGAVYALNRHTGEVRWRYETGDSVIGTPAVHENTVYIGCMDGSVYALDARAGDKLWEYETDGSVISSPSVGDSTLYIGSSDTTVYAIDLDTGTEEWTFDVIARYITGSPSICDETVYIGIPGVPLASDQLTRTVSGAKGAPRAFLYALSADTGEERWSHQTKAIEIGTAPAIVDGVLYFGSHSQDTSYGAVHAITVDGEPLWEYGVHGEGVGSSPAVVDGIVYVGGAYGALYALEESVERGLENTHDNLECGAH